MHTMNSCFRVVCALGSPLQYNARQIAEQDLREFTGRIPSDVLASENFGWIIFTLDVEVSFQR